MGENNKRTKVCYYSRCSFLINCKVLELPFLRKTVTSCLSLLIQVFCGLSFFIESMSLITFLVISRSSRMKRMSDKRRVVSVSDVTLPIPLQPFLKFWPCNISYMNSLKNLSNGLDKTYVTFTKEMRNTRYLIQSSS